MQYFAVGIWAQRFDKLKGALVRVFDDLYAPSVTSRQVV